MRVEVEGAASRLAGAHFRRALGQARAHHQPFDYWLLEDALPTGLLAEITALPFPPPSGARFDGRRETNNSSRTYVTPQQQSQFRVFCDLVAGFGAPSTISALADLTGADLTSSRLRVEYCQDVDGFWLEPHVDIPAKRITILIYLSEDTALADAGTDIYEGAPDHRPVARAPCGPGKGLIFVPGDDTWHGFTPRPIHAVRRSLIVNFVGPEWRAVRELA